MGNEIDRAKGLEIARTCTYFNVRKATRILADAFDVALRPYGLRGTQFSLLVAITLMEEPTVGRLAEVIAADRTTLTRTLAPLERDGLIASEPGSDRRERRLRITIAGEACLAEASAEWERVQRSIVGEMGEEAWSQLMAGARAVHTLAQSQQAGQPDT
ncbi:MAG: MarR family winged helix-turn-helix transcriptional regulator [Trueperaceae bacterium]